MDLRSVFCHFKCMYGYPELNFQAMSEAIANSPEANEFVACEASAGEKWLREAKDGQVRKLYSDFMSRFRHRCLREVRNAS